MSLCVLYSTRAEIQKGSCRCMMAAAFLAPHVSLWACLLSTRHAKCPKTKLQIIYGCSILGSLLFFSYEPVSHTFHVLAKSCRISMISPTVGVLWYTGNLPTKEGGQCTAVPGTPMTWESFVLACFNPLPPRGEGEKKSH